MATLESEILVEKLDLFIRKFYKNRILKGVLYTLALGVSLFLLIVLLEYIGRFNSSIRGFLLLFFAVSILSILLYYILLPGLKWLKLGKTISNETAANIIGNHFPEIKDKLLNTLQLQQVAQKENNELLIAAIEQKQQELSPIPFQNAVNYKENTRYLKYAVPPIAILLVLLFAAPSTITRPSKRIIQFTQAEEAPFEFIVTSNLTVTQNSDAQIELELKGNEIPEHIFLLKDGQKIMLEKEDLLHHKMIMPHVSESFDFQFLGGDFQSQIFHLSVIPEPKMSGLSARLIYPSYLHKEEEQLNQVGDLTIPEGTIIQWAFQCANANELSLHLNGTHQRVELNDNRGDYQTQAYQSFPFSIVPKSNQAKSPDSLSYFVTVIPDQYPLISLVDQTDSLNINQHLLTGDIQDDYGISALYFYSKTPGKGWEKKSLGISENTTSDVYYLPWDVSQFKLNPGDTLQYYLEVWDNDGVHGAKSSKTSVQKLVVPSLEELEQKSDEQRDDLLNGLSQSQKEAQKIQQALKDLEKKLLDKKEADWQDKKKLDELLDRQKKLQEKIEELKKENLEHQKSQENQMQLPEELLEKQKQLDKLFEQLIDPETKRMMEELKKMMENIDKNELQQEMEKMRMNEEDLEKELDRTLEQFKELEVEQKLEKTLQELKELSEKQEQLAKEAEEGKKDAEQLKKEQEQLNKEFQDVKDDLKKLEELNKQLEEPKDLPNTEELQKEIQEEQQKSSSELQKNKKENASKNQKKAAEKMEQMSQEMESAMEKEQEEEQEEDMASLRQLLENLVSLSFDQEKLMNDFAKLNTTDPNYDKYGQRQRKINDDMKMVKDSLFALSKRVNELSAFINKEVAEVQSHMDEALKWIPERQIPATRSEQQFVMTGLNNLALMLEESLQQMQQQQQQQQQQKKSGKGKCNKPGGKGKGKPKPSAGQMKKMQESLSKQLEELKKQGKNQGQNKSGNNPQLSKELAGAAAKQAALRKMMEDKAGELNQDGSGAGNELKQIAKEMEQIQKDIVNNNITEETLRRQRDILTRLLKAENAERTQGEEEKRESQEGEDFNNTPPRGLEEYMKKKTKEAELLQTIPPQLKPYYKNKANQYLMNQNP